MGTVTTAYLLALDGGNSKTDVLLVADDGTVVARARSGPFAPHIVGAVAAVATLVPAVEAVLRHAPGQVALVAGYLANADLPEEERAIAEAIDAHGWADRVIVGNDTLAMLRTGTDAEVGVAIVCGAGINCVGIAPGRDTVRYPALGRLSGDWGGGLSIGEEVLWHTTRAEDGRGSGAALPLARLVAAHFDRPTAVDVATSMHLGSLDRERMHELVPVLFRAASAGDPLALTLVQQQADEIVLLAVTTLRRLSLLDAAATVILGGGMLTSHHRPLLDPVIAGIRAAAPRAVIEIVDAEPVLGSALLGLEHLDALTGRAGASGSAGTAAARRERLRLALATPQPGAPHSTPSTDTRREVHA